MLGKENFCAVQWADDPKSMTYLKYDNLDRVVETGEVRGVTDFTAAINTNANDMTWPGTSTSRRDVARYHYDAKASTSTESGWNAVTTEHPGFTQRNTRLRLSWTDAVADWPANVSDINDLENVVRTFYSYDPHGSATTVINDIPVTSDPETDRLITRTDYTYDLSTGNVTAVDFQKDKPSDRFQHRYTYDAAGRMKIVETSRNGVLWDRDVVYDYNLDGSLRRETIGEDSVQGRDYTYTLLGQLKGINHPTLDPDKDPGGDGAATGPHANVGKDAFGMSFHYHEDDFLRSHNTTASPFNDAEPSMLGVPQPNNAAPYNLYSGYIGGWAYQTQATNDESVLRDGMLLGERFRHDKIGRLRSDTTYSFDGTNWISDGNGGWGSRYVLDQNSNMIHIKRWSMSGSTSSILFDDAVLSLINDHSNVIAAIDDSQDDGITDYDQELTSTDPGDLLTDSKGRMTAIKVGAVTNVTTYTSYDVPSLSTRDNTSVCIIRDSFGEIVRVDSRTDSEWNDSKYIIAGSVKADQAVYVRSEPQEGPTIDQLSIVGHERIGVTRQNVSSIEGDLYRRKVGESRYELTDHLGSVRALVTDILVGSSGDYSPDLVSVCEYEPYGAQRDRRMKTKLGEDDYRYAFQGMRLNEGSAAQAEYRTPLRLYDSKTGRWSSSDPVLQPWASSYEGLGSNPIVHRDPSGNIVDEELKKSLRAGMKRKVGRWKDIVANGGDGTDLDHARSSLYNALLQSDQLEADIDRLDRSPVLYRLGYIISDEKAVERIHAGGFTYYDESSHSIVFDYASVNAAGGYEKFYEIQFHEFRHMMQFESGEVEFSLDGNGGAPDVIDELDALNYGVSNSSNSGAQYSLEIGPRGDVIPIGPDARLKSYVRRLELGQEIFDANGELVGYRSINVADRYKHDPSLKRSLIMIGRFSWVLSNPLAPSIAPPKVSKPLSNPLAPNP